LDGHHLVVLSKDLLGCGSRLVEAHIVDHAPVTVFSTPGSCPLVG
jgi:hypothetical protein